MERLVDAIEALLERGRPAELHDRTIRLTAPVQGDAGSAALGAIGLAQDGAPVGAAAHGPDLVAAAVWQPPHLYVARWSGAAHWVVGYRLPAASKPDVYVRAEGRIPTHLEAGRWGDDVPDEVAVAFLEVGLDVGDPPFPRPPAPPPRPAPAPARSSRSSSAGSGRSRPSSGSGRARTPKAPPAPKPAPKPTSRLCLGCHMQKALPQFVEGSDLCVDCR